jgi:hypothetical protein
MNMHFFGLYPEKKLKIQGPIISGFLRSSKHHISGSSNMGDRIYGSPFQLKVYRNMGQNEIVRKKFK